MVLFAIIMGLTLGSIGSAGRSFIPDLQQLSTASVISILIGGVIFNGSNILLSASTSIAGMSVAFPVGVGLALVLGVFINYFGSPKGDPFFLFIGVAFIVVALIFNGLASAKKNGDSAIDKSRSRKGILLAIVSGILMSLFYRFVAAAMDLDNFEYPASGKATPYTAFFIFSIGVLLSNFIFNTLLMKHPIEGAPVSYKEYFKGTSVTHLVGMLGGVIWGIGTLFNYIAAGKAGAAISYALGQGAPMIAALWGVFVWKEFKGTSKTAHYLLTIMFILFIIGLGLIVSSGGN
ncbi:multidrug DMT transporter permease [Hallella multisaccharivorax DSM 17128]|nr:multidrug DMT transporter permease [Hallella multisaccharivorax DSM 17128]